MRLLGTLLTLGILWAGSAYAGETDQFLSWNVTLQDSAGPMNAYLNFQAQLFLDKMNRRKVEIERGEELAQEFFTHLFGSLFSSRVRAWIQSSRLVDRYPPKDITWWQYQRISIHRGLAFPYILPMSRTVRIGDVYFGTDKIGHFFGFGRRYYKRYVRHRQEDRDSVEEATERVIRWGISQEGSWVGKMVDGIFSSADLEANYQGFLLARDLCEGDNPIFGREDSRWVQRRPIDFSQYVTPDLDESFNTSYYWLMRKRQVLPLIEEEYCERRNEPIVRERFARYREGYEPSLSQRLIDAYVGKKSPNPKQAQSLEALCDCAPP
ncbi:MAG: hypothetical protein IT368_03520 [Candidatus Hydrogenedentes bacterium]|nr:hypothetical protein [Candidatus Hydrogenedentota bacterium]